MNLIRSDLGFNRRLAVLEGKTRTCKREDAGNDLVEDKRLRFQVYESCSIQVGIVYVFLHPRWIWGQIERTKRKSDCLMENFT